MRRDKEDNVGTTDRREVKTKRHKRGAIEGEMNSRRQKGSVHTREDKQNRAQRQNIEDPTTHKEKPNEIQENTGRRHSKREKTHGGRQTQKTEGQR